MLASRFCIKVFSSLAHPTNTIWSSSLDLNRLTPLRFASIYRTRRTFSEDLTIQFKNTAAKWRNINKFQMNIF